MTSQERSRSGAKKSEVSSLWFERLYAALRITFWIGAILFGGVGFLAILVAIGPIVSWEVIVQYFAFVPVVTVVSLLAQGAARMARRRIEELNEYGGTMAGRTMDLRPLYSVRNFLLLFVATQAFIQPIYTFYGQPQTIPLAHRILLDLPFIYWNLFMATFWWVWLYSMYAVYKIGRLPLTLKPFTEDRSLGLKPFGTFSLQLTAAQVAIAALIVIPNIAVGLSSLPLLFFFTFLFLLAPVLFLIPLFPLSRKLQQTKREMMSIIGPRYTRAFERIRANPDGRIDQDVVNELTAVDKIQRDVQQIRTWPFDASAVIRLSAIIVSVTAIVLARIVQRFFGI